MTKSQILLSAAANGKFMREKTFLIVGDLIFFERRDISDITSRDGKLFWNRFTVPYQLFIQLLTFAESWFPQHEYDCCKKKVPSVNQLQPQRPMNSS
jgi:hypothetical protein